MARKLSRQKEFCNQRAHGKPFNSGDLVWLNGPTVPRSQSKKLHCPWKGPYKVVKRLLEAVYSIRNTQAHRKSMVVHFDRLNTCCSQIQLSATVPCHQLQPHMHTSPGPPMGAGFELLKEVDEGLVGYPKQAQLQETRPVGSNLKVGRPWRACAMHLLF